MKKAQTTAALIAMFASYAALAIIIMLLYWYISEVNTPDAQQDLTSTGAQQIFTNHQLLRNILRTPITIDGETMEFSDVLIKEIESNAGFWGNYGSNELNTALRNILSKHFTGLEQPQLDVYAPNKKLVFRVDIANVHNQVANAVATTHLPTLPGSTHPYYEVRLNIIYDSVEKGAQR